MAEIKHKLPKPCHLGLGHAPYKHCVSSLANCGSVPVYTSASLLDSLLGLVNNTAPKRSCCQDCGRKKDSEQLQRFDEANRSIFVLYAGRFSNRRRASEAWFKPLLCSLWLKTQNSSNWSNALQNVTSYGGW
jgi:hypothetical protein